MLVLRVDLGGTVEMLILLTTHYTHVELGRIAVKHRKSHFISTHAPKRMHTQGS